MWYVIIGVSFFVHVCSKKYLNIQNVHVSTPATNYISSIKITHSYCPQATVHAKKKFPLRRRSTVIP